MRFFVTFACCALTAASTASDAQHRSGPRGLIVTGLVTEGGTPSKYEERLDLAAGRTKRIEQMGNAQEQSGFDGQPWDESNGIVMVSNLPSTVAQRRARAWLDLQAWRLTAAKSESERRLIAPGGVPAVLTFNSTTGRLDKATIEGDWGPVVFTYGDWRQVGSVIYPFRREEVTPVGERTIIQAERVMPVARLPGSALARALHASHAEPLPTSSVAVPFEATGARKTHIVVAPTINGVAARLIFDTGAANYLTTEAAAKFGVHPTGGVNLSGVGESSEAGGYATVDRIALGAAALRNETLVVGPSPFPPPAQGQAAIADGFTGFEFLAEYVTMIDYPAQQLRFAHRVPKGARGLRVPFYNDGSHFYVRARLNGVDGYFGVDTGDGGTVMVFPAFAARLGLEGKNLRTGNGGVGGQVRESSGVIDSFILGGLEFRQLPVRLSHNRTGAFASRSIAGNLGGAVLRCFRITIDFPNHLLLLDPAPEHCEPGGTVQRQRR